MYLVSNLEFRGFTSTRGKEDKIYNYVNLEDEHGESCKFFCDIAPVNYLEKGEKYDVTFDYSSKYGSLKVVGIEG